MIRRSLIGLILRGFDSEDREEILQDLEELTHERGALVRPIYFWWHLIRFPLERLLDRARFGTADDQTTQGDGMMRNGMRDLRYAWRSLARNRGFAGMAIVIMALSMGATTAIYSVVDGVLLEPLPLREPDALASVWLHSENGGRSRMTPGTYTDVVAAGGVFESAAAFGGASGSLGLDGASVFLRGASVTPGYFETLGVEPLSGRTFRADEGEQGGAPVVIISEQLWRQSFGSDPAIIGRRVPLDDVFHEVVGVVRTGVLPTQPSVSAELSFTAAGQDFFVPLRYSPEFWTNRRPHILGMVGRLEENLDMSRASQLMAGVDATLHDEGLLATENLIVTRFTDEVVGDVRFALWALLGTVALVLLIAVVNVGALFVLRTDDRRADLSIHEALGASRGQILRQLLAESGLIALMAGAGAILVARLTLGGMRSMVPYQIPRLAEVSVSGASLAVTIALGFAVALVFGLLPVAMAGAASSGRAGTRRSQTAGRGQRRFQALVVATQAALGVVVLVGAGLLTRSYLSLRSVDTGFDAGDTWVMTVPAGLEALQAIASEVSSLPSVARAAVAYDHPLERNWGDGFSIPDRVALPDEPSMGGSLRAFGDGYFDVVGIDFVEGRAPTLADMGGDVGYAVINQSLASTWFADRSPIGARIFVPTAQRMVEGSSGEFEIMGVVEDVRFLGPEQPASPAFYLPLSHFPTSASRLLVRPNRADSELLSQIRGVVERLAPSTAVQQPRQLSDILDGLLARPRFNMMLLVSFGTMGLVLCGLGAYGLVGRVVVMQFREIGIRMALGADRGRLARSVMGTALRPMIAGGLAGLIAALGAGRVIQSLLFEVDAADTVSLLAGPLFVLAVGVIAAALPTLRALAIDPASSLRQE